MNELLTIHVLWHPDSVESNRRAQAIADHFNGLGMERDGVSLHVPVRFRSQPWDPDVSDAPRDVDLGGAEHNTVVFLHDDHSAGAISTWDKYVDSIRTAMKGRRDASNRALDFYLPFQCSRHAAVLPSDGKTNYGRPHRWTASLPNDEARTNRLLLHVVTAIRAGLRRLDDRNLRSERLFVSHAKADGDVTAQHIVNHVNDTGQDVPLHTFYDAKELMPGQDYQEEFIDTIDAGTLLALVSDTYDSRPWCVFELTQAKRARRPIVLADIGKRRTNRTYPYGGNLPRVRFETSDQAGTEALLLQVLSEGLRCDLFMRKAEQKLRDRGIHGVALPRPPELFDLVEHDPGDVVVYPDPPLPDIELDLLRKALQKLRSTAELKALGELP